MGDASCSLTVITASCQPLLITGLLKCHVENEEEEEGRKEKGAVVAVVVSPERQKYL